MMALWSRDAKSSKATGPVLVVEGLDVYYGRAHALQGVSFTLERGVLGIVGRNGMGKTTLCNAITGLVRASGSVRLHGQEILGLTPNQITRGGIAYVPQGRRVWPSLSVDETLRLVASKRREVDRVYTMFPRLAERKDHGGAMLSGGEQQMLAIGRALLLQPQLLVMDEPTSNLDAAARDQLLHLLAEVKAAGKTIIFSSHRIEEVETLADRVLVMEKGQVRFTCAPRELPTRLGWRAEVKLRMAPAALDTALHVLQADGFTARRNGVGVIVEVAHGDKARPIHVLSDAEITVTDFEME